MENSIVIYGAGNRAREIIEVIPNKWISCVVDNDKRKQGSKIKGIQVTSPMKISDIKNAMVILTFIDQTVEESLKTNHISYTYSQGIDNNFFNNASFVDYLDENLYFTFLFDKRIISSVKEVELINHWRESYISEKNKLIVEAMRRNEYRTVNYLLQNIYDTEDKIYYDEQYSVRPGMRLAHRIISERNKKSVCDIACGHGSFLIELGKKGFDIYGCDSSILRVNYLRKKGINVKVGEVENIPFENESFDVVTSMECMEHIVNPCKMVDEAYRILKPNGIVIVTVPYKRCCESDYHVRHFDENLLFSYFCNRFIVENIIRIPYLNGENDNNLFLVALKR